MKVDIVVKEKGFMPTYGTEHSAAMDLYAADNVTLHQNLVRMVHTGVHVAIPEGYFGLIRVRSSIGSKQGVLLASSGIVDSDYTGELMMPLYLGPYGLENQSSPSGNLLIERGTRVGQMVLIPYAKAEFNVVEALDETERGTGGFGSTGV